MFKLLTYLNRNKFFNIILVTTYFFLVTLPHEWVGVKLGVLVNNLSRVEFNRFVLIAGSILLFLYFISIFKNILISKKRTILIFYLLLSAFLAILSLNLLIIVNVEIIHFIQFGILAILLLPLFNDFFLTFFICLLLGFVDEGYQYYYLPVRTTYFDFNDVVLDLIGAGLGLSLLRTYPQISTLVDDFKKRQKYIWISWASILIGLLGFIKLGWIQLYSKGDGTDHWTTLVIKKSEGFWTKDPHGIFHVMSPLEGIICLTILLFIYQFITKDLETNLA